MSYKLLYKDDTLEVRKYPPHKRTVSFQNGSQYNSLFLPMPYMVYVGVTSSDGRYKGICIAFAKRSNKFVYSTPFNPHGFVCVDASYHYAVPAYRDMGDLIKRYWNTSFYVNNYNFVFANINARAGQSIWLNKWLKKLWSEMTTKDVCKELVSDKMTMESYLQLCRQQREVHLDKWLTSYGDSIDRLDRLESIEQNK
jgi:hypothetical protein